MTNRMVLVTGATGILGRVLLLELLKKGKVVRATKRPHSNLDEVRTSFRYYTDNGEDLFRKIEWVDVDIEDLDNLREIMHGVEEVYHCLARVSFAPKDTEEMLKTNVEGTKNMLYIAEEKEVKKFLFVSSIIVFDKENDLGTIDETSEFNTREEHSGYALSKYLSEMEVWRANAEGLNTIIINPGVIIGSGNWGNSSGTLFPSLKKLPITFSGNAPYVDVRDVAQIAVDLMEREIFGKQYIVVSENRKYKDIASRVRKFFGKTEPIILPQILLNIGYMLNLLLGWLIPSLRMLNKVNINSVTKITNFSNDKIKKELDYQFIPIDESIDFHLKNYNSL